MAHHTQSVCYLSREFGNVIGVGGIKDLAKGVSVAAAEHGLKAYVFLLHPPEAPELHGLRTNGPPLQFDMRLDLHHRHKRSVRVDVLPYTWPDIANLQFFLVQSPEAQYLEGNILRCGVYTYTAQEALDLGRPELEGQAYEDLFDLNVLLIKATLHTLGKLDVQPDLFHCFDAHTSLLPLLAQYGRDDYDESVRSIPTLATIPDPTDHYRGEVAYSESVAALCGVSDRMIRRCLHEGKVDPVLIAGLFGATINTVSENFARELRHTGLDWRCGWLIHRLAGYGVEVLGIPIGLDPRDFDPTQPKKMQIPAPFDPAEAQFDGKDLCKQHMIRKAGLEPISDDPPVLTFVGRLVQHKGFDVLASAITRLFSEDEDVLLIGNGGGYPKVISMLQDLQGRFPNRISIGYHYDLAWGNQIYAGGDFCLIPSLYEAGGTVDMIASLFGNLPIVHAVGGLVKVLDGQTGFCYQGRSEELYQKLREVIALYRICRPQIRELQVRAAQHVLENFTWAKIFRNWYWPLYDDIVAQSKPLLPTEGFR